MKVVVFLLVIVSISCALPANYSWANQNGVNYLGINQNQNIPSRC